jgi:hypothetical protein
MENSNIGFKMIDVVLGFRKLNDAFMWGDPNRTLTAISVMMNLLRNLRWAVRAGKNALARVEIKGVIKNETKSN